MARSSWRGSYPKVSTSHKMLLCFRPLACLFALAAASANHTGTSKGSVVEIPYSWTYLLPDGFTGNINGSFINATRTGDSTIDSTLRAATEAPFIAYDPEFYDIFGRGPQITLIQDRTAENDLFAFEAGVWVPEKNEAWFTSADSQAVGHKLKSLNILFPLTLLSFLQAEESKVSVLNLNTSKVSTLNSSGLQYANGGCYFQGKVYFATYPSNTTYRGGIYSVDVQTLEVGPVVNSYFGLPFLATDVS